MATRTELRGFLKESKRTSAIADARVTPNLNPTCRGKVNDGQTSVTDNEIPVRTKSSNLRRKECVNESLEYNDELVKYMSKVPGYLQRMGRGEESVQRSNVLNVGVLDWERLEKWKHGRARDCSNALSRGGERSGKSARKVSTIDSTTLPNDSHMCKIDDKVHTCSNLGKGKSSRDLQHSVHKIRYTLESELASRDSLNKSSDRDHEGLNPEESRRLRSYQESASGLFSEMGNSGGSLGMKDAQKRAGEKHVKEAKERGKQCVEKLYREEKITGDSKEQEFSNIVLIRSRKQSQSTLSSGEPQMSLEDNMRMAREVNCSLDFSDGINRSFGSRSQIPRACPPSFDLERDTEDVMLPLGVDISGKKERLGGRRHSKTASRIFNKEIPPEVESRKNRQPSPNKRFSFSFGRLSRSFTFKEDSSAQPLSSSGDAIKPDFMGVDGSVCMEKQNIHSGSGVGPLRSLIDPLLKSKVSENVLPSKERSSSSSNSKPTLEDEKNQDKDTSRTRALFQLTIRNGIPLLQFVVDDNNNNRSILGATMKTSSATLFKDDSIQYCTFYSVNEVKKKKSGSWLIHGHKEKQRGFVYNEIGHMRLSNSSMSSDYAEKKSGNVSTVIVESVLFDETENEVAAVVIQKKPVEETSLIIPGGVHSIPEKGEPSPLISRWRSGGLCDCGGWDVGCKLHVLSNKTLLHEFDQSFKLFHQEGSEKESGPALAMTELKSGIYRVEFGSFLSHLQAFFICVTVVTCGSQEEKTIGKSSSPFAPPLSPVGRV